MAALTRRAAPSPRRPGQQGFVLLLTLISLLVLLFGVLFTMRGTLLQSVMTGNTLQRQKDVQASDLALRQVQQAIIATVQGAGDVPLEIAGNGKAWFYIPGGTTPWITPGAAGTTNAGYWSNCVAAKTCDTLSNVVAAVNPVPPPLPGSYQAWVTVVPTNQPANSYACGTTGYTASYYDIFLHTTEANGTTAANTDTVFKLCTP